VLGQAVRHVPGGLGVGPKTSTRAPVLRSRRTMSASALTQAGL